MSETPIICKATRDTFVRFGIVLAAFFGFGLYFFYDAAIGYRKANEAILSFNAFSQLGAQASKLSSYDWSSLMSQGGLIAAAEGRDDAAVDAKGDLIPLPAGCEALKSYPDEVRDQDAMSKSWMNCWSAYSERMHHPIKPGDHAHDEGAVREQWYGGAACMLVSVILLAFMIRTSRRELSLRGDVVCAAGKQFKISDIERIDLRQWGKGFKGAAYFTVGGRSIKADGMTYGGFGKAQGEPAEKFMQALLARYTGEIVDYEKEEGSKA